MCYGTEVKAARIQSASNSILLAGSVAGSTNGLGSAATFMVPAGLAIAPTSDTIYVADKSAHTIRKLTVPWSTPSFLAPTGKEAHAAPLP